MERDDVYESYVDNSIKGDAVVYRNFTFDCEQIVKVQLKRPYNMYVYFGTMRDGRPRVIKLFMYSAEEAEALIDEFNGKGLDVLLM